MSILVFDIETVPDVALGRRLHDLSPDLEDAEVAQLLYAQQRIKNGSEFLPHHQHQVVAISVLLASDSQFKLWTLGDIQDDEATLITRFWSGLEKYMPTLVSYNGKGFDMPVLHYRSLHHKLQAPKYWETGEKDQSFKWNNYLNRYHARHLDIMDMLSGWQTRAVTGLDTVALMCGLPGKQGMSGSGVYEAWRNNERKAIRDYCETDVLNTYLVYLRFQWMRGQLSQPAFQAQYAKVKAWIEQANAEHLNAFVNAVNESEFCI